MKPNRAFVLTTFALSLALQGQASTILFSTFGPEGSFWSSVGYRIGGGMLGPGAEEIAVEFTPAMDGVLTQIRAAVFSTGLSSGDRDLVLDLFTGDLPGTPIDSFSTIVAPGGGGGIYTFNSVLQPELLRGQSYWIAMTSNDLIDNFFGWNFSSVGSGSILAGRSPGESIWGTIYNASPAFDVSGLPDVGTPAAPTESGALVEATPEPSSLWMMGAGVLLVLVGALRRSRDCGESAQR